MSEVDTTHTPRQIALIKGEVQPDTSEEWSYIQEHASDVLPGAGESTETKKEEPGFVIVPPEKELNLHKPKDIGETSWQKRDK
ncbi:MAG: hypothetical protein NTZ07_00465 [Candidatus Woesebacteria bacterium]|nr:hypothetical protein [Candidatus Woesebacteria bacterium]